MSNSIRRLLPLFGSLSLSFVVGCGDLPNRAPRPSTRGVGGCDARPAWVDAPPRERDAAQDAPIDAAVAMIPMDGGWATGTMDAGGADAGAWDDPREDALGYMEDCGDAGEAPVTGTTVVVLPDTQFYASSYPTIFEAQVDYILAQKERRHIAAVLHVGDVVDNIYVDNEWLAATKALRPLDNVLPYILVPGNHDQDSNRNGLMDKYFLPSFMLWMTGTMVAG
jgi:hypothetical protein